MRPLSAAVLCTALALVLGCATTGKSAASTGAAPSATMPSLSGLPRKVEPPKVERPDPGRVVLRPEEHVPALSYDLRGALKRPPKVAGRLEVPLKRTWKYIVIHHSASSTGNEAIFDREHRLNRGWQGVGYDFVIGNGSESADGLVEVTFRWEDQITGAHASSRGNEYNERGIGICLVGNFEESYPTARQMEAVVGLVNYLQGRCEVPTRNIIGHRDVPDASTQCPGRNFPWYEFLARLDH